MWDYEDESNFFLRITESMKRHLNEAAAKAKDKPSYQMFYDDCLSKFNVFNYLHQRSFLTSRERLLDELRRLLDDQISVPDEVYDKEQYKRCWRTHVNSLIELYQKNEVYE